MFYQRVSINPTASGDTYETIPDKSKAQETAAIFSKIDGDVYELGVDILPEGVEDIRGKIHNKPDRVFAVKDGSEVYYFGINAAKQ